MEFLVQLNQFLWGGPLLFLLLGMHLLFTFRLKFVQRKIGSALSLSLNEGQKCPEADGGAALCSAANGGAALCSAADGGAALCSAANGGAALCSAADGGAALCSAADGGAALRPSGKSGFGRFGSLATTLAATLGTGNIVGVSTAVFLGGPGAVFWCLLTGLFGMATTYAETWLCSRYRYKDSLGNTCSGVMYLLENLLKKKWSALVYSAALCLSAFFIGCTTQSSALTSACSGTFHLPPVGAAVSAAFVTGFILTQGRRWIEKFSIAVVPAMAFYFMGSCILYLILHAGFILPALREIIFSAFRPSAAAGGVIGFTIIKAVRYGVARGLFTNEAGLGTAGLIAGSSAEQDAHRQALVSMGATFFDTVVLCTLTGIVLVAFQLEYPAEWIRLPEDSLVAGAFSKLPFWGEKILAVSIICFALATLVGWSFIGLQGFNYLFCNHWKWLYYTLYMAMIFVGGIMPVGIVWELTDFINLFLLLPSAFLLIKCRGLIPPP